MVAVITALFFTCAAAFAVLTISRTLTGSVDRIDAVFAQYRSLGGDRVVTGRMRPVVHFSPAPAPDFAPRTVVSLPRRAAGAVRISQPDWRAAA
ncbi:MAG: hypothetical protein MEP44_01440 [Blastomonas sp.]|nr:hypothetical protein [Blastomonas sp.]